MKFDRIFTPNARTPMYINFCINNSLGPMLVNYQIECCNRYVEIKLILMYIDTCSSPADEQLLSHCGQCSWWVLGPPKAILQNHS